MPLASLVPAVLQTSIFLLVLSIGLTATPQDALMMARHPGKLLRMVVAMNLVVPAFAVAAALAFELHPTIEIAMVAIAISPVPPVLPIKAMQAGPQRSYAVGLLTAASVLSVAYIPLVVMALDRLFPSDLAMSPLVVAKAVSLSVLAPLAAGLLLRRLAPRLAERSARLVMRTAVALLALALLPVLVGAFPRVVSLIGNGTLLALAALVVAGLVAGHLLGGPAPEERSMLALASASRHPAVAVALAHANFPDDRLVVPAVLLYLIVCMVVTTPYLLWSRRRAGLPET
jgi:bile acid:Na+ symporter, BASS family